MSFDITLRSPSNFDIILSGGGFQAAWSINSNVVIGAGNP